MAENTLSPDLVLEAIPPRTIGFPPITFNGGEYSKLTLREPGIGQLIESRKVMDPVQQLSELIRINSGLPPAVVLLLPQRVLDAAGDYFETFSPPSQPKAGGG